MALETVTHISDLNVSNPTATDGLTQGDDHIRNLKTALKTDFPNINGVVSASDEDLSACENFEETISATTSEVSIATGKTLNIVDDGAGLEFGGTALTSTVAELNKLAGNAVTAADLTKLSEVTATSAELNICDAPNAANKALKLDANAIAPIANLPVDVFTGSSSVSGESWSGDITLTLSNVSTAYGVSMLGKSSGGVAQSFILEIIDENGYVDSTATNIINISTASAAGTLKLNMYNADTITRTIYYRVVAHGTV